MKATTSGDRGQEFRTPASGWCFENPIHSRCYLFVRITGRDADSPHQILKARIVVQFVEVADRLEKRQKLIVLVIRVATCG
jgi:hypothetical protein